MNVIECDMYMNVICTVYLNYYMRIYINEQLTNLPWWPAPINT